MTPNFNHTTPSLHTLTHAVNPPFNAHRGPQGPQTQLARDVNYICGNGGTVSLSAMQVLEKHSKQVSGRAVWQNTPGHKEKKNKVDMTKRYREASVSVSVALI